MQLTMLLSASFKSLRNLGENKNLFRKQSHFLSILSFKTVGAYYSLESQMFSEMQTTRYLQWVTSIPYSL